MYLCREWHCYFCEMCTNLIPCLFGCFFHSSCGWFKRSFLVLWPKQWCSKGIRRPGAYSPDEQKKSLHVFLPLYYAFANTQFWHPHLGAWGQMPPLRYATGPKSIIYPLVIHICIPNSKQYSVKMIEFKHRSIKGKWDFVPINKIGYCGLIIFNFSSIFWPFFSGFANM